MDKPSSSRPPQKSVTGRRLRLIRSTPQPEGAAIPPARQFPLNTGVPQPLELFGGNLYANIIRETIGRWNRARLEAGEGEGSSDSSSSSSSSLRFSDGREFDEIADEVIQDIREEERERTSGETQESKEPVVLISEEKEQSHEGPLQENHEVPVAEEGEGELDNWKTHMENTINQLRRENAALNERMNLQEEQTHQLMRMVERIFSNREEGTQTPRQPLPACSSSSQNKPSMPYTEVHLAESSRKRKPSIPISPPTSAPKRARNSGFNGSQSRG